MIDAVILVGGRGSRLGSLTKSVPKPLLCFRGRPFLDYLLQKVTACQFNKVVLIGGYLGSQIKDLYDGSVWNGTPVVYVEDEACRGTLKALEFALSDLSDRFFVFNGDTFFELEKQFRFDEWINGGSCKETIFLFETNDISRYGSVEISGEKVLSFREKLVRQSELPEDLKTGYVNTGISILKKSSVRRCLSAGGISLEVDLFPFLAEAGALHCSLGDLRYIYDFGVPLAYNEFEDFLNDVYGDSTGQT